jgi:uncharacterized protein (DUF433 family)
MLRNMLHATEHNLEHIPVDSGSYTAIEAARLIKTPVRNIRRWMLGYTYSKGDEQRHVEPLWNSQLAMIDDHLEIGFRDLVELRFVKSFTQAGVGLLAVRNCMEYARECVDDNHPFSTQRFQTDGRTIFLESLQKSAEPQLLDLKKRQYVFKKIIEKTFKDLDIAEDALVRWRPYRGKSSIVIDPHRSFGQPVVEKYGVPTVVFADAVNAEGSIEDVARLYEVSLSIVRDAFSFEKSLAAA